MFEFEFEFEFVGVVVVGGLLSWLVRVVVVGDDWEKEWGNSFIGLLGWVEEAVVVEVVEEEGQGGGRSG